ncbi:unnamed protein product [Clonostachys solani]|uniref:Cytochrome P450 n=1 Tax=Clonostachys solani TaxID=160281 RepID=A0A9P0EJL3_9HYPO|nr:unnamed protein product [Clonostachys solani]
MISLQIVLIALAASIAYAILAPVVRYWIDPKGLRQYPNYALLSPFTDLRHVYLSSFGYRSRDLYLEHKRRNEPILRIGPNALSFCDNQAIKDIYGHGTPCTKDLKEGLLAGSHRHLFDVVDKPEHARKRKLLSAAFAIKNLESWEYKVAYTTERLFKALDGFCTAPLGDFVDPASGDLNFDFNHWINLWTIEAINYIALSAEMDLLDTGKDEVTAERRDGTTYRAPYHYSQNMSAWFQATLVWDYNLWPWTQWVMSTLPGRWRKVFEDGKPTEDVFYHLAAERLRKFQAGERPDDFFSSLLEDKAGNPNNLQWGEMIAEVGAIINAGADTTAIAMTQHMLLLYRHPEHLETLRQEVETVLDRDDVISPYDKVKDLPFLRACIDESLRLMPPTSAGLPRRTPKEGARILNKWIPGDTSVSMTIYAAHRDEDIFPDPEAFKPERWLDPANRRKMESSFIPFSAGSRSCLGRNITYLEQVIVLASIVHRYNFALTSKDWDLQRSEAFNILCGPMPMKIWRRDPDHRE